MDEPNANPSESMSIPSTEGLGTPSLIMGDLPEGAEPPQPPIIVSPGVPIEVDYPRQDHE